MPALAQGHGSLGQQRPAATCSVAHAMPRPGTLPYLTLPYLTLPYLTLPYLTLPYLTLPYLTLPYLALPCLALPCLALPCLALPCLALPCLALPCLALPCLAYAAPRMAHTRPRGVACQCLSEPGVPRHVGRMLCVAWRAPRRAGHLVRVAWHASRRVARACQATSSAQPLVAGRAPPEWSGSYLIPDSQGYRANVHWFIF
jgi:hypothetical protein